MIRISHTLLLSCTLLTTHAMEHEKDLKTKQNLKITQSDLRTTQSIELTQKSNLPIIEITSGSKPVKTVSYNTQQPLKYDQPPLSSRSPSPKKTSQLTQSSQSLYKPSQQKKEIIRSNNLISPSLPLDSLPKIVLYDEIQQSSSISPRSPRTEYRDPSPQRQEIQQPLKEDSSRKTETLLPHSTPIYSTSSTSSSTIESSPRKKEIIRPSTPLTQSTSSSRESSPRKKTKSFFSLMTQSSSLSYDDSDPEDPLLEATKNNDLFKVLKILNINTVDNDGNTAFIIAARDGHKKIIIELLKKPDIKPNIQNRQKMTALHCAAREGRRKILQILVRDPRVDSSLQEINKLTFLNYLGLKDKFKSKDVIKQEAFARVTLDTFVNNEVKELYKLIMSKLLTINLTQNDVELSRKTVINNIIRIANNQSKGGELTASATLPEYASNEFIERMIRWRLFYLNEATLSSLDQAILLQQTLADIKKDEKLPNSLNTTTSLPLNQSTLLQQTLTDIKQYEEFPEYLNTATTTNTVDQALLLLQNLAQQKEEKQLSDYL